jgi:hypothetical protein
MLSTQLRLCLPSSLFPFGFPTSIVYALVFFQFMLHAFPISSSRWIPCHHGIVRTRVAHGGDALQLWRGSWEYIE